MSQRPTPPLQSALRSRPGIPGLQHGARALFPENKVVGIDQERLVTTAHRVANSDQERAELKREATVRILERSRLLREEDPEAARCSSRRMIQVEQSAAAPNGWAIVHLDDGSVCDCPGALADA